MTIVDIRMLASAHIYLEYVANSCLLDKHSMSLTDSGALPVCRFERRSQHVVRCETARGIESEYPVPSTVHLHAQSSYEGQFQSCGEVGCPLPSDDTAHVRKVEAVQP